MKIEIKHSKERDLYDKLLFIAVNLKKIKEGKITKIKKITDYYKNLIILGLACTILFIILYLCTKHVLYLVIFIIILVLSLLLLYITKKVELQINEYVNNGGDSVIELDKDKISLSKKEGNFTLNWDNIEFIIVNADLVCFVPKDVQTMITVSSKYKDDLLKGIKKYKKESLIRSI